MQGTYWGIASNTANYESNHPGYSKELVDQVISQVRTDLDAFSDAEAATLENHGYLLADAAINRHVQQLSVHPEPCSIPHPQFLNEALVRKELSLSHKRKFPFGRW
jgi:NTE family protein